ncbi:hypothetical protein [Nocardioides zeae]|uniref:Uncharacterized protein n=1 Tax=Nocardioides zeae TaxID=1457234 RepID=A0A6P0HHX3_9ACTN|nr:hypothetical protein [Nocardioides zeae]NEN78243.1 hypothetical protein [Nocardioides zeae]
MHPAMGPHYEVPREPDQTPLGPDEPPPRLGRGKRGTWVVLAVIAFVIALVVLVAVVV